MKGKRQAQIRIGQVAIPLVGLLIWQGVSSWAGPLFLPSPMDTLRTFRQGIETGWLWENLEVTLIELLWGYLWSVAIGLVLGFSLGMSLLLREAFESPLLSLYAIPKVTLFPIFLFLFRLGPESKIAFGAFHGLFPVAILTWNAMKAMKAVYLKVGRSLRLNSFRLFKEIVFPSVLPSIMTGLRLGFNLTFLGIILGEMFGARRGLGFLLMAFGAAFDMERVLVVIILVALLAIGINSAFYLVERRLGREEEMRLLRM